MEVVVNVHARLTTTTKESLLGAITSSKGKLITSEISYHEQTDCACLFEFNCFNLPAECWLVDATGNTPTTTPTQLPSARMHT